MLRISLRDVGLDFRLRAGHRVSLKEYMIRGLFRSRGTRRVVEALAGINLEVHEGQRIGIVGHNGAGKSTLLRLIAGIYTPTSGQRIVQGRISSLLDIGVGIESEATGWENIFFRGYMQGNTPDEIRERAHEIAEFSELGDFLDVPVRCYSSGMMVRLVFAIATSISPEILVIDEVFSAGDLSFQEKARGRMLHLMERAQIMVMASHDLKTLNDLCEHVLWLDHGRIRMEGPAAMVTAAYEDHMRGIAAQAAA